MDKIELAIRSYARIAPDPGGEMTLAQAKQLASWLEQEVSEIVESIFHRPAFRRQVKWPIKCLTGESNYPEREAIIAVEESLVRFAKKLDSIAQIDAMTQQLLRLGPYQEEVPEGDPSAPDSCEDSPLPIGLREVRFIATKPWRDLASPWDYFRPTSQFNLKEPENLPWGQFLPWLNPDLRAPGDYVTRCIKIRISDWRDTLNRFYIRCQTARQNANVSLDSQWTDLEREHFELDRRINRLWQLLQSEGEARVRDSCIALLQIYLGYHQEADVSWLGDIAKRVSGTADIPHRVLHRREWEIPERAVAALVDVLDIVRRQPPEELIEEMKTTNRLVLIEGKRRGYFDGESIDMAGQEVAWHGHNLQWELLFQLANRAGENQSVDCYCLSNPKAKDVQKPPSYQAVKDRRAELKKLIVTELDELIVDAGRGTYRLELNPQDICLLGETSEDRLEVLSYSAPRPLVS